MYSPSRTIRRFVALALCNRCSRRFTFSLPPPFQINPSFPTSWSVKFRLTRDRDQHSLLFAFCFVFLSLTSAILCHYIFWSIRAYTQRTLRQSKSFNLLGRRVILLTFELNVGRRLCQICWFDALQLSSKLWCSMVLHFSCRQLAAHYFLLQVQWEFCYCEIWMLRYCWV